MNKTEQDHVWKVVDRAKKCLLGKLETEFNARLPIKPEPLTAWEKYKLIKDGTATLKRDLTIKQLMPRYSGGRVRLTEAFTYPDREEDVAYKLASEALQEERDTRELAIETAFNRIADERIMNILDGKTFLDLVEQMQQQKW